MKNIKSLFIKGSVAEYLFDFLLTLLFVLLYFQATKEWKYSTLEDLTGFKAYTPFQYRILLPFLVSFITQFLGLNNLIVIYQLIMIIFVISTVRFLRIFLDEFHFSKAEKNISVIIFFYILLWNYPTLGIWIYPYDIPAILFFLIGLIFIKRNMFLHFFPIFIIGCFNRETIILVLLAYWLSKKSLSEVARTLPLSILYFVSWLLIKYFLYLVFINNPAETTGRNLFLLKATENLNFVKELFLLDKFYLLRLFSFGGLYFLIPFSYKYLDEFSKKMLMIIPIYIVIIFFVGKFQEVRIYSELIPLFIIPSYKFLEKNVFNISH